MSSPRPQIEILLSTYNGMAWLRTQLQSLQAQSHVNWRLWIRDDGSTDATRNLLENFASTESRVNIVKGSTRLGPCHSFAFLLETALEADGKYFAFCDQDDEWLPTKLEDLLSNIENCEVPAMVFSDLLYCNSELGFVKSSYLKHMGYFNASRNIQIEELLCQNIIVGCSVLINRKLASLAKPFPKEAMMHDWWLALVCASAGGRFNFVPKALLRYRVHESNYSGAGGKKSLGTLLEYWKNESLFADRLKQAKALKRHIELCLDGETRSKSLDTVEAFIDMIDGDRFAGMTALVRGKFRFQGIRRQLSAAALLLGKRR